MVPFKGHCHVALYLRRLNIPYKDFSRICREEEEEDSFEDFLGHCLGSGVDSSKVPDTTWIPSLCGMQLKWSGEEPRVISRAHIAHRYHNGIISTSSLINIHCEIYPKLY